MWTVQMQLVGFNVFSYQHFHIFIIVNFYFIYGFFKILFKFKLLIFFGGEYMELNGNLFYKIYKIINYFLYSIVF